MDINSNKFFALLTNFYAFSSTQGEILLEEIYRGLIISAAHLHLMIRDAYDSARYCPSENRAQHHNIRQYVRRHSSTGYIIDIYFWP